jgi:hypothetical protein
LLSRFKNKKSSDPHRIFEKKNQKIVASDPTGAADCNGMTSMWPSDVRELCDGLIPRPRKKTLITKEKEEKMGQINTMKTKSI